MPRLTHIPARLIIPKWNRIFPCRVCINLKEYCLAVPISQYYNFTPLNKLLLLFLFVCFIASCKSSNSEKAEETKAQDATVSGKDTGNLYFRITNTPNISGDTARYQFERMVTDRGIKFVYHSVGQYYIGTIYLDERKDTAYAYLIEGKNVMTLVEAAKYVYALPGGKLIRFYKFFREPFSDAQETLILNAVYGLILKKPQGIGSGGRLETLIKPVGLGTDTLHHLLDALYMEKTLFLGPYHFPGFKSRPLPKGVYSF